MSHIVNKENSTLCISLITGTNTRMYAVVVHEYRHAYECIQNHNEHYNIQDHNKYDKQMELLYIYI